MDPRQKIYIIYRIDIFADKVDKVYIPRVYTNRMVAAQACRMFNFESCKLDHPHSYNFEVLRTNLMSYERRFENKGLHD